MSMLADQVGSISASHWRARCPGRPRLSSCGRSGASSPSSGTRRPPIYAHSSRRPPASRASRTVRSSSGGRSSHPSACGRRRRRCSRSSRLRPRSVEAGLWRAQAAHPRVHLVGASALAHLEGVLACGSRLELGGTAPLFGEVDRVLASHLAVQRPVDAARLLPLLAPRSTRGRQITPAAANARSDDEKAPENARDHAPIEPGARGAVNPQPAGARLPLRYAAGARG